MKKPAAASNSAAKTKKKSKAKKKSNAKNRQQQGNIYVFLSNYDHFEPPSTYPPNNRHRRHTQNQNPKQLTRRDTSHHSRRGRKQHIQPLRNFKTNRRDNNPRVTHHGQPVLTEPVLTHHGPPGLTYQPQQRP
jgi:hypothetical protein